MLRVVDDDIESHIQLFQTYLIFFIYKVVSVFASLS